MPLLNVVIDLSHNNDVISFQQVKDDGILGVIHKATQGRDFVDGDYERRKKQATDVGLFWGAYHFGIRGNPIAQADHFLSVVNPGPTDLLVLDFEPNGRDRTMTLAEAEDFVRRIQQETGRFPGLYSGQAFIRQTLGNRTDTVLKECFLWIARFSSQPPLVPPAFPFFTLLQYTDGNEGPQPHRVNGIGNNGRCDRDKFNGSEAGLRRLFGQPE